MKEIKQFATRFRRAIDLSVYAGEADDFHRLFEIEDRDVHEHRGLSALGGFCGPRL